jgi:hypothetical protein
MSEEEKVRQVLGRYVRAADHRNGKAMAELFAPGGKVEMFHSNAGRLERLGELVGPDAIIAAVEHMMQPHPARGWSHHTTHDAIIEVDGDRASIDAQFVVFNVVGAEMPQGGWPAGAVGAQGTITPIESGYYRPILRRVDGRWLIETHRIYLDLPMAFPAG